jgi:hypothetical protein
MKVKSVIKIFISVSILLISTSVFATEVKFGFHYDNFGLENKNIFGASVGIKEELSDKFAIHAVLENNKSGNYSAYCAGGYDGKIFNILGGFLFDLRNSYFTPGFVLDADILLFDFITIGANTNFTFSTKNIFENYITEMQPYLTFHCQNQDISLIFDYSHTNLIEIDSSDEIKRDFSIGGYLDVLALDERSPFKIGLFFGAVSHKKTYDEAFNILDLNVGGRFIFDLEKFGFVVAGESTVYKVGIDQQSIPFAVSLTTRFAL